MKKFTSEKLKSLFNFYFNDNIETVIINHNTDQTKIEELEDSILSNANENCLTIYGVINVTIIFTNGSSVNMILNGNLQIKPLS